MVIIIARPKLITTKSYHGYMLCTSVLLHYSMYPLHFCINIIILSDSYCIKFSFDLEARGWMATSYISD